MVIIVDPHLKRTDDYPVYKEATDLGLVVKKPDGTTDYEGWCWSGSSAWVDYFHPGSWDWWKSLFKTEPQGDHWSWVESTAKIGVWNDMNEVGSPFMAFGRIHADDELSLPSSTGLKLACLERTSTTAAGSTVTSTTSMECSSYVVALTSQFIT